MNNPASKLVRSQSFQSEWRKINYYGPATMQVTLRYDDKCGNGHNSFAITADIRKGRRDEAGGCLHDLITEHFPEYTPLIKWHLTGSDGPIHYVANTIYWAEQGNLENARSTAVWPEATLEQLQDKEALTARLPGLLNEFKAAMESAGFEY